MNIKTPNTFIVGAGPVATALAGALRKGGVPVLGLWARRSAAARTAGAVAGVGSYSTAPPDVLLEADAVIVAVRDEAIGDVASMLLGTGLISERHVMLHCAGARPASEVFAGVRDSLGGIGTLHPLEALADGRSGIDALGSAVFGIEGDARGVAVARVLVEAIGGRPLELSEEQMAAYHAAAAMASNYLVTLIHAASTMLTKVGLSQSEAAAALVPLCQGSLRNVSERGAVRGLTGPIRRGDTETVGRHLESLADADGVDDLYRLLGRHTVALARHLDDAPSGELDAIERLLGSES